MAKNPLDGYSKVHISAEAAGKLDGSGDGMGESFWVKPLTENTAEVCNNCMCGLCIGDIIEHETLNPEHWPEFKRVIQRKSEANGLYYTFDGMDDLENGSKFPDNCQKHLNMLAEKGIRFEGMVKGLASVSRPIEMDEDEFFKILNSGPMKFSAEKIKG